MDWTPYTPEEKKEYFEGIMIDLTNINTRLSFNTKLNDEEKRKMFIHMILTLISDFQRRLSNVGLPHDFNEILMAVKIASIECSVKPDADILSNMIYKELIESVKKDFKNMV